MKVQTDEVTPHGVTFPAVEFEEPLPRPIDDRILVLQDLPGDNIRKVGRLFVAGEKKPPPGTGIVLQVGTLFNHPATIFPPGTRLMTQQIQRDVVQRGDRVMFSIYGGFQTECRVKGSEKTRTVLVLKRHEICAAWGGPGSPSQSGDEPPEAPMYPPAGPEPESTPTDGEGDG